MQHIPATPPMSPLGQALAAIIQILIAAIAEYAREHPLLAGGCRASIRQLEKLIRRFDALAAEWQATRDQEPRPTRTPPHPLKMKRQRDANPSRRRPIAMDTRATDNPARAPPARCSPANRPQGAVRARPLHA